MIDYCKYYDLESYLFDDVVKNFHDRHYLTGHEFFCIVMWKANRAKHRIAKKLEKGGSIEASIKKLTSSIYKSSARKDKLAVLINDYHFYLPTASTILSVLYQDDFSVYDFKVCDILEQKYNTKKFHKMRNWRNFERLWKGYEEYSQKILELSGKTCYREADKYLWGKAFYEQLGKDLSRNFR